MVVLPVQADFADIIVEADKWVLELAIWSHFHQEVHSPVLAMVLDLFECVLTYLMIKAHDFQLRHHLFFLFISLILFKISNGLGLLDD